MSEQWYEVYNAATGEVVSIGTVLADPLPSHLAARPIPDPVEVIDPNTEIVAKIRRIEAGQWRAQRDYFLNGDKTALQSIEDQIAALRTKLQTA